MNRSRSVAELRAAIVARLPESWRTGLRLCRDQLQRTESRVRAKLPERWGGRLGFDSIHIEARLLEPSDSAAAARLRGLAPEDADTAGWTDDSFLMGVFADAELIATGTCITHGDGPNAFHRALYAAVYVHPRWRRRGVAQLMHRAVLSRLRTLDCEQVFCFVDGINRASFASFQRCGFRVIAPPPELLELRPAARHRCLSADPRSALENENKPAPASHGYAR